ncbi:cytochrome P450 [Aspergillus californicus]
MAWTASIVQLLGNAPWLLLLSLVVRYLVHQYQSYRKLSHIPGPWIAAWSHAWNVSVVLRQRLHLDVHAVSSTYGPLVRIGPNEVLTTDADFLHRIQSARSQYRRSDWYKGQQFTPGVDNLLSMTDDKTHGKRRAQMRAGFTRKGMESIIDRHIANLIHLIRRKYAGVHGQRMDLAQKAQFFTIDVITELVTGASFGNLALDQDRYEYLHATDRLVVIMSYITNIPWITWFFQLPWVAARFALDGTEETGPGKMIGIVKDIIEKRVSEDKPTEPDMLQTFLDNGITKEEAVFETMVAFLGGSDTSSMAIGATMLLAMTNPRVYYRLQSEIDHAVRERAINDRVIKDSEASQLPYLQAVIKEGLRLYPPVTGKLPKRSPVGGDDINGVHIPGGVEISMNVYTMLRSGQTFGPDGNDFRPERWLDETMDPVRRKRMEYVLDLIWGGGKYKCLGQKMALIQLPKIVFELMRNFEWSLIDPSCPWQSKNTGLWIQKNLDVRVLDRGTCSS